jgi:hypothetical protein
MKLKFNLSLLFMHSPSELLHTGYAILDPLIVERTKNKILNLVLTLIALPNLVLTLLVLTLILTTLLNLVLVLVNREERGDGRGKNLLTAGGQGDRG